MRITILVCKYACLEIRARFGAVLVLGLDPADGCQEEELSLHPHPASGCRSAARLVLHLPRKRSPGWNETRRGEVLTVVLQIS